MSNILNKNPKGKIEIKNIYSLSPMQEGMLFHYLLDKNSKVYFEQQIFTLEGDLDINIFEKSFNYIVEKYDIFRTIFEYEKFKKPMQVVLKNRIVKINYKDISSFVDKEIYLKEFIDKDQLNVFDLKKNALIRIAILKMDKKVYKLIWSFHHILMDGWCNGIIISDILKVYHLLLNNQPIKLESTYSYMDYINWINNQNKEECMRYWKKYLDEYSNEVNILGIKDKKIIENSVRSFEFKICENDTKEITRIAYKASSTMSTVLHAIWGILLQKYNNTDDVVFGTVVSGRNGKIEGIEKMVGLFINTIPIRVKCDENTSFLELLTNLQNELIESNKYDYITLAEVQSLSELKQKLINNIMIFENYPIGTEMKNISNSQKLGFEITETEVYEQTNYNFNIMICPGNEIIIKFFYNENMYSEDSIARIQSHFENAIKSIVKNNNILVTDINILPEEEKYKLLGELNDTYAEYARNKTINELFEEKVEKRPDKVAVMFEDKILTYRELNDRANKLARTLREKGVKADNIVGIMVERSFEMIVGILAVLKAGGAYLPIDPWYPEERIKYMLTDSKTKILLTQNCFVDRVAFNGNILDIQDENIYSKNGSNLERINISKNLAYVIYTSGSTGNPKGVIMEHSSAINTLMYMEDKCPLLENDVYLMKTAYTFDVSIAELFGWFIGNGRLVMLNPGAEKDAESIINIIEKYKITHINFVPSMLEIFLSVLNNNVEKVRSLKYVFAAGEAISRNLVKKFFNVSKTIKLENIYGPTEAIYVTRYSLENFNDELNVPIGKPVSNTRIYIVDKNNILQPIGVMGELCISGDGLARGYLNKPEVTSEKFIESPFVDGERMYKTGDLARWLPDGNIEFIGRVDHQVKIRGFRIELGEIESQLLSHESVNETTVVDREDENGTKYLCAYLVSEKELTVGELRDYLSKKLPEYMIPSYFIQLDRMPLTPNGKINRRALPKPDGIIVTGAEYEAARNEAEEKLVAIWRDVLGIERVGINDNFFELGGHSLKATILVSRIHKELNVEMPLREIFKFPTIKGISEYIESTEESNYLSIEVVETKEYYEASSAQKRMYMLQQFDLKSTGYNMPRVMLVEGRFEVEKLEKCLDELIRRHETLRTYFEKIEDKIVQKIDENVNFKLERFEVGCIGKKEGVVNNITKDFVKAFDLSKAPLLRVGLIKLEEEKYILMFDMHHIISDGVSMGILINEFAKVYEGNELGQLRIQYKDYSEWQNSLLKSEVMQKQKEYWISRFKDEIPVLNMRADYVRPLMQSFEGENISFKLDKELTKSLKQISKETNSTMYMILLSGINILLSKYSGQEDITIGSPIAGRSHADFEKIIGMFVNTLAIRNRPEGSKTYEDFLKEVKENALEAYENQDYQFDELVENLNITRDISRNPLFDVMFTMQNIDSKEIQLKNLVFKAYEQEHKIAKFDLTFSASEMVENIILNLQYSTKLYKRETIEIMIEHFINILKAVVADTKIKLSEIDMLTAGEKRKLLIEFNDTYFDYQSDKAIHELFEEQVEKTPDNVAIIFEDKKLTYRELNQKANKLAYTLREKGVKNDSIVGIIVERSLEMAVGMLGILKSGGAYLPIDPEYPVDRIRYMIEDSNINILLTQSKLIGRVEFHGEVINLENEEVYSHKVDNLEKINALGDLAYVIYTSGSTGRPKGVMIEHGSIATTLQWRKEEYKLNSDDSVLQLFSNAFDAFITSFYTPIISGSQVVVLSDSDAKNVFKIRENILMHQITHLITVPSMCLAIMENLVIEDAKSLKVITLGGEGLTEKIVNKCKNLNEKIEIVNEYGPTENSVVTTIMRDVYEGKQITIGKPKVNTRIYIVDKKNKLQSIGVPGEICISGEGLARGYLNNPELTSEKFIESPFIFGERMYKTGDLGRWLPDGNIEFLGRIDYQVKIRGFRIELGEIESQLLKHELVEEAIVLDKEEENGSKYLCAYLVSERELTVVELRYYLSKKLPEYMIPSYFVQLDKMPLTPNGKIDRQALPEPYGNIVTGTVYEAARNEVEEKLIAIWREVLGTEKVGINDNFFELGGHSLKATTVVSKIHKDLNVEVPLREIFKFPTIKGISEYIKITEKSIYSSIEKVAEKEYYEVSSAQKRMYMLQQFDLDSTGYNIPGVMIVEGKLKIERLEMAFELLIRRHETLRTSFERIEEKIVQIVNKNVNFELECFEVDCIENQREAVDNIIKDFVKAFDLSKAPLLRVGLIKLEEDKHILMFDIHHIISDGVSVGILINEFAKIYEGNELQELRIQYKDYSAWQNNLLKAEVMQKQKEYWINRFNDEIPVLNMRTDFQRPIMRSFEGESIGFKLNKELTKNLKKISKETGSTMYMVLLSGINILLSKYSGQKDIIIGSPIAGRPHADLEKIIGMFVNTLAMRNHPEESKSYENFLREVRENALMAYENQDYQFDELVDSLSIPRDISRNPLFDVMFTMQNINSEEVELKDFVFKVYNQQNKIAKFDLTFSASEMVEDIILNIQYSTKLYKRETIERMIKHFVNILKAVAADRKIKLSEIDMLTEEEKHELLFGFNDTYVDYPNYETIHELFEEQVEKTPDNIAVIFDDKELTYRELNKKANKLAWTLREKGVKPDSIVGIMTERSLEMIVGMFGVLKSGAAYLPIDPEYPADRIKYMIEDSNTNILLTQSGLIGRIEFYGQVIDLNDEKVYSQKDDNLEKINTSGDLAYVIYTSGSTGRPKGVLIEHRSIATTLQWRREQYKLNSDDSILQLFSNAFDGFVTSFYTPIISGSKVVILSDSDARDVFKIRENILIRKITHFIAVPSMFLAIIESLTFEEVKGLRVITLAGENLTSKVVKQCKVLKEELEIVNEYGPTENSVVTTIMRDVRKDKQITIGKPKANTRVYILDKKGKLQPIGVPGEICISGEGLARGYLNKPELTAEKFIESPFISGERMYKTGDLGRWMPDGNIEFLGRIDHQVKIRGFRIELGEIESQLLKHELVEETIVIDREDENGTKYLCAYLVSEKQLTVVELRNYLLKELPEYMIPSYFVQLEKMPLTSNGKIDRKALIEPDGNIVTGAEYEAPRNEVEEKLVVIWSNVLGINKLGINDNFFELGGHSLKAIILVGKIHKELDVEISISDIFKTPTIKGISNCIKNKEKKIYQPILKVEDRSHYLASHSQKRLFIFNQLHPYDISYNMTMILMIDGELDINRLENALENMRKRHAILRTSFKFKNGEVLQIINENCKIPVNSFKIPNSELESMIKKLIRPFDLSEAPLVKANYIKTEENKQVLMIDMHHIISDGISMQIFKNELIDLYQEKKIKDLEIQYKDFSVWQNNYLSSEYIKSFEDYWIKSMENFTPTRLPQKYYINSEEVVGLNKVIYFNKEVTISIDKLCKKNKITKFVYFVGIFNVILMNETSKNDITIGVPTSGRNHDQVQNLLGLFLNVLLIRTKIDPNKTFKEYLKNVNENIMNVFNNENYPYEELYDMVCERQNFKEDSLFTIMLNYMPYQNNKHQDEEINIEGITIKSYNHKEIAPKYDMTLYVIENKEDIEINMVYKKNIYEDIIERMAKSFEYISDKIIENDENVITEIDFSKITHHNNKLQEFDEYFEEEDFFMND